MNVCFLDATFGGGSRPCRATAGSVQMLQPAIFLPVEPTVEGSAAVGLHRMLEPDVGNVGCFVKRGRGAPAVVWHIVHVRVLVVFTGGSGRSTASGLQLDVGNIVCLI